MSDDSAEEFSGGGAWRGMAYLPMIPFAGSAMVTLGGRPTITGSAFGGGQVGYAICKL